MTNIISLDGKRLYSSARVTPLQLFHHNRALWVCGSIGQQAYLLGSMLIAMAHAGNTHTLSATRRSLLGTYVATSKGQVLTGMLDPEDKNSFTFAMQELHDMVGIHSVKKLDNFDEQDMERRHFTRSPVPDRSTYDDDTALFFRLPTSSAEHYAEHVATVFCFHMNKAINSITLDL